MSVFSFRLELSFQLFCFSVDPPDSPDEHRQVRNLSFRESSINDDYRFNMNVTWDPPIYPYKQVESYIVYWLIQCTKIICLDPPDGGTSNVSWQSFLFVQD